MALAKMRAAVLYLPCGVLCTVRVLRHDSALNPALRQALKRYFPIIFPKISCAALGITVPGPNTAVAPALIRYS